MENCSDNFTFSLFNSTFSIMTQSRYISAGGLIDGSGAAGRRNVFLEIRDGIIRAIGPLAERPAGAGETVDLSKFTIVPPLVDCSVSLAQSPSVDPQVRMAAAEAGFAAKAALAARHLRYCHDHGVLGVAEVGEPPGLAAHSAAAMPGTPAVDMRIADRDFLRIIYSGSIGGQEARDPQPGREGLFGILQQRGGKKAVVVANGPERVAEALDAGCDAIEQGYAMGEANLARMAAMGVLWIPSVLTAQNGLLGSAGGGDVMCRFSMRYVAPGKPAPGAASFWKKMLAGQLAQLRLAKKLAVKTAVGTGAGSVGILHGESVAEEIKLFVKGGYTLEEAVRCGSVNGARFFGMEGLGELAAGRRATFLVARSAFHQLPRKLAFLENIYVGGEPRL